MKKIIRKFILNTDITCLAAFAAGFISIIIFVVTKIDISNIA